MSKIIQAMRLANKAHSGQLRKDSIEPYVYHCARVALLAATATTDEDIVIAAWLHDVLEDSDKVDKNTILLVFGNKIYDLVLELTNIYTKINYPSMNREERKKLENERLALVSDSAKFIKLCDRLDNIYSFQGPIPKYYKEETKDLITRIGYIDPVLSDVILDMLKESS